MNKKPTVIKVGTAVITDQRGCLDVDRLKEIIAQVAELMKQGQPVVIVTSGAVAAGCDLVNLSGRPDAATRRQVLAAAGQVILMSTYDSLLKEHGLRAGQVLATKEDFRDRAHYLNVQQCLVALLENNIVPVVNENDAVATDELMFTDNDELAGLLAAMLDCEKLFLLTSVDGLLDEHGKTIAQVEGQNYRQHVRSEKSSVGRGGMGNKCTVASRAARLGIACHIINGQRAQCLVDAYNGTPCGTLFVPSKKMGAIKKWLAQSRGLESGSITVNEGAERLLADNAQNMSLLPVGITTVVGEFKKGDVVHIVSTQGKTLGYGRAEYSAAALREKLLKKNEPEFINHDYLYIEV